MTNQKLKDPIHFIGIGGCSMSGIAFVLSKKGYKVQGSDLQESSYTARLADIGVKVYLGHSGENIKDAGAVVYSSAVSGDNEEFALAKQKGLEVFSRGRMLANLMKDTTAITVCGSHGKTTTSSLISFLFFRAGLEPTFIVGGNLENFKSNAYAGKSDLFIAEADESDGSFLFLSPSFEVITNIEEEHLDYYKNLENLKNAFLKHIHNIKDGGFLIAGGDDEVITAILSAHKKNIRAKIITYGLKPSNSIYASNIRIDRGKTSFDVVFDGENLGNINISLAGIHNVKNALACIAVGLLNGIEWEKITEIMPEFGGVARRFQVKGRYKNVLVIDDYAHHPTEIKACLSMAECLKPKRKIVVFQPHRYTRTKQLAKEFAEALKDAEIPILIPIYEASEKPIEGVSSELICEHLKNFGVSALHFEKKEEAVEYLKKIIAPGDIFLTIGAGDVYKIGEELIKQQIPNSKSQITINRTIIS